MSKSQLEIISIELALMAAGKKLSGNNNLFKIYKSLSLNFEHRSHL